MSDSEAYALIITSNAKADLKKIDKATAERILKKMIWVAENANDVEHEVLTGQWSGLCRWRIGNYRVVYRLDHDEKQIIVEVIGHRREVYDD